MRVVPTNQRLLVNTDHVLITILVRRRSLRTLQIMIEYIRRVGTSLVPTIVRVSQKSFLSTSLAPLFSKPIADLTIFNFIPPIQIINT